MSAKLFRLITFLPIAAVLFAANPAAAKLCKDGTMQTVTGIVDRNWVATSGAIYAKKYSEKPCSVGTYSFKKLKNKNVKHPSHITSCAPGDRFTATGEVWVSTEYGLLSGMRVKTISCEKQ